MTGERYRYVMLMASLPRYKRDLFAMTQPPVSEIQLNKRLDWLEPRDASDLAKIQSLLYWSKTPDTTDQEFIQHASAILEAIQDDFLKNILFWRLELRTVVTALRKRHQGLTAEPEQASLGIGRWLPFIRKHWDQSDFMIGRQLPWLEDVSRLIAGNQSLKLETYLLNLIWQHYARQGNGHDFDFAAVVIYVLRWDVIKRWAHCRAELASQRFASLLDHCLDKVEMAFDL